MDQLWLQPAYYADFECIGPACEDTCCSGWGVSVDRETFELYQQVTDSALGPRLQQLVTIQALGQTNDYARLAMQGGSCALHRDGFCSVQADLGEEYLGRTCATYPRVVNVIDGVWERSLDLSCPQAARLALLNPEPDNLHQINASGSMEIRLLQIARDRKPVEGRSSGMSYSRPVREYILQILQDRRFKVEKRLLLVGFLCEKLQSLSESGQEALAVQTTEAFQLATNAGLFDEHLQQLHANPVSQLTVVLELVIARMKLDYTAPRFRDLYNEFTAALQMQLDSTVPQLSARYLDAHDRYLSPFLKEHDYILEHYLVAYAYRTLFPFRRSFLDEYLLLCAYFGVTRALAIGLAGKYQAQFEAAQLARVIQVCSRTLEHCGLYPDKVLAVLTSRGITNVAGSAILTQSFLV